MAVCSPEMADLLTCGLIHYLDKNDSNLSDPVIWPGRAASFQREVKLFDSHNSLIQVLLPNPEPGKTDIHKDIFR